MENCNVCFSWKPASEIPTEHWERNNNISPEYLVNCGVSGVHTVLGYASYSFATNEWMSCYRATEPGIWKVQKWTNYKI